MKRLVMFVEGEGDLEAVPILVKRLLRELGLRDSLLPDEHPFRIGGVERISGKQQHQRRWVNHLKAALKRPNVGGVLVVLDGDARAWEGKPFCAAHAARTLVSRAKESGAGITYSLGFVFACCEYETWLLAGLESLAGRRLPDGRSGVHASAPPLEGDLERSPRGAKESLGERMPTGYKPSLDQAELTKLVDIEQVRSRGLRSFARLENAIKQLAEACKTGVHVATPQ